MDDSAIYGVDEHSGGEIGSDMCRWVQFEHTKFETLVKSLQGDICN